MAMNVTTATERFMVLRQVVDYVRAGPFHLYPPAIPEGEGWLEPALKMSEFRYVEGPFEARSLYLVPRMLAPAKVLPIVRQVVWSRTEDEERCKNRIVEWPDVRIGYFQVHERELEGLDAVVKDLEAGLKDFPFEVSGLDLEALYGREREDETLTVSLPTTPPHRRYLSLDVLPASVELRFGERVVPPFDERWERVWDALGAVCRDETRLEGCREEYWIPPRRYAKLLTSTLT